MGSEECVYGGGGVCERECVCEHVCWCECRDRVVVITSNLKELEDAYKSYARKE